MQLTVKENERADYSLHKFNALVGREFYAYADTEKAAYWACRERRRLAWKMRIERLLAVIERYL